MNFIIITYKSKCVQMCAFGFMMDLEDASWNNMFEKELPKYKVSLDTIFPHCPFETINVNTTFSHVFSHLQKIALLALRM